MRLTITAFPLRRLAQHIAHASLLLGASSVLATPAPLTGCTTTGNVASLQCGPADIQMQGNAGASSLTVTDVTASSVAVLSNPSVTGPFTQTLTIDGTTTLNRSDYPAVYMYSSQPGWNANLLIGSGVSLTSAGPFGAVWLRSESSDTATRNEIRVDSAATVTSYGANSDGITATSNNGPVSVINRGRVTVANGRGLYADGGSASLTPVDVSITNLGTVNAYQAGARAINYQGTARIDNQGSVRSTTRQGLIAWSANGGAEITNSGTVVADHYDAVVAAGTDGNVVVTNSGRITANRNPNLAPVSPDFHGINAYTDGTGTVTVSNTTSGVITAASDAGMAAASAQGAISMLNAGRIDALTGLLAESNSGPVNIINSGTLSTTSMGIHVISASAGSVVNTGTVASAVTAVQVDNGATVNVENRAGGTLMGNLALGNLANLSNAGNLYLKQGVDAADPLSTGTTAAGTVGGNFTQAATGTLGLAAGSTYSSLAVGGNANLGGTVAVDVKSGYGGGDLNNVVTATGGVTNSGLRVTDNSLRYAFSALFRSNAMDLVVRDTGMTSISAAVSPSQPGALGAASVWDSLLANGSDSPELAQALNSILGSGDAGEVNDQVEQTLPLLTGNSLSLARDTLGSVNAVVQSRIDSTRGLSSGDAFLGDRHLWLKPFATHSRQDSRNGVNGYSADTQGLVAGLDGSLSANTDLGVAFAYAKTDVDSHSGGPKQSADVDSYQLILYGRHALDAQSDLSFQLDGGRMNNDGRRQIDLAGLSATSDYTSKTAHAGVAVDRRFALAPSTTFVPSIRLDYTWIEDEAYREKGAGGLDLQVKSRSTDALVLGVDGTLTHALSDQLKVSANLGAGYDLYNRDASITSIYAGAPDAAFVTYGTHQSAWSQRAGAGLTYTTANGTEITGRYDATHKEGFLGQTASVQLRWMF
ncbi:autotransporter outer membrane beta-barrel domain-containing protein [Pseudomonas tohonis]|uniref:autotransporter outer membrane beta-barrel domain-containing protein n=1 Tax=Pseudomonas tohonis TaxID=2725477 RepID=UPI001F1F7248|nr:autotransporter outer membrane beta-barrel domain-containing protein [Pseudomonas tohonis]